MQVEQSLCNMKLQISNENKPYCRSKAKVCTDRWIKLHARDTWMFSCCTECAIRIICPNNVTMKHLRDNGVIGLDPGCTIRGESFTIHAQHDYVNQMYIQPTTHINVPVISTLNEFMNISLPYNFTAENHEELFTSIKKNIDDLKRSDLKKFETHGSTHYIVIYTILFLMTTLLLTLAYFNLRPRCEWKTSEVNPNPAATNNDITLDEIVLSPPPSSSPIPRMTVASTATRGSTTSVDTATSPTIPRKIHFNLNASTGDLNN